MLTFKSFAGINNTVPSQRLVHDPESKTAELASAVNVDVGLTGEVRRRAGFSELLATCHKNLHQANGFILATVDGGDLIAMDEAGSNRITLYPSLGVSRVWYCNLPDGRTTFSNGLICGITNGATATTWGVPRPAGVGAVTDVAGDLFAGEYRYGLTHVRLADGLEGAPVYSAPFQLTGGGIVLTGLPELAGHKLNVYLIGQNSDHAYLAGSTTNAAFSFIGKNESLTIPCRTDNLDVAPAGTVAAFAGGRMLVASGSTLFASRPHMVESFDYLRDFKQFTSPITLIQPVDDGIYVGTETELVFMSGVEFDKMTYRQVLAGPVVLGSGVQTPGDMIRGGQPGTAMLCIADGVICAGFNGGNLVRMTEGRYQTETTEVAATFRMLPGRIPQYLAIPQDIVAPPPPGPE